MHNIIILACMRWKGCFVSVCVCLSPPIVLPLPHLCWIQDVIGFFMVFSSLKPTAWVDQSAIHFRYTP